MKVRILPIIALGACMLTTARAQHADTIAAGTTFPIRFLQPIVSGKNPVGERLLVQTLAAVVHDSCVELPAYTEVVGRITVSQGGSRFGRGGSLGLRFDSLRVDLQHWVPITGLLDSLEYVNAQAHVDTGTIRAPNRKVHVKTAVPLALAAATEVAVIPAAILTSFNLTRRGPRVRIIAGEIGRLALAAPMVIPHRNNCLLVTAYRSLYEAPALPDLIPRTETKKGQPLGDPINLIIEGSPEDVDAAFIAAGWTAPHAPSFKALSKEAVAVIVGKPGGAAPVSTQYFEGRPQDLSYELPGPNARIRHHLRMWLVDTARGIWAGAANQDIGMLVKLLRFPTHRISPQIDDERDFIVRALEAGGCADLLDYVTIPDAPRSGRNAAGQVFHTDGRAAVIRARPCTAPEAVSHDSPPTSPPG